MSKNKIASRSPIFIRSQAVLRVQRKLESQSYPRLQMALITSLTGAFGLFCSFLLLSQGVTSMAWRYPLALALSYFMFLFLIWLWLRTNADDYGDISDLTFNISPSRGGHHGDYKPEVSIQSGGGGEFAGGGASGSFEGTPSFVSEATEPVEDVGKAIGAVSDADEMAIPLIAIVLIIGLALASFYPNAP